MNITVPDHFVPVSATAFEEFMQSCRGRYLRAGRANADQYTFRDSKETFAYVETDEDGNEKIYVDPFLFRGNVV